MKKNLPDFSDEQWLFLAVLDALGTSAPIHIAGHLAPLLPGPLFDVISRSKELGWIVQKGENNFTATRSLKITAQNKLADINSPEHIEMLINRLNELQIEPDIKSKMMVRLMKKGGLEKNV